MKDIRYRIQKTGHRKGFWLKNKSALNDRDNELLSETASGSPKSLSLAVSKEGIAINSNKNGKFITDDIGEILSYWTRWPHEVLCTYQSSHLYSYSTHYTINLVMYFSQK